MFTLDKALTGVVGCKERGRQVDGPLDHSTGKGWVKDHAYGDGSTGDGQEECSGRMHAGWKWMGRSTTTQLRREVGQESHNAAGARGNFGWHCAAHQAVPPRVRQGSGGHQHGPDGRCIGRRRRTPPPLSSTTRTRSRSLWRRWRATPTNINKQARKMRTNGVYCSTPLSVPIKRPANGLATVGGARIM